MDAISSVAWRHEASALAAVTGLNLPVALQCVGGRHEVLLRVLHRFAERYRSGEPQLLQGDLPDGARAISAACHSLRGACASVGALGLAVAAQRLESELSVVGKLDDAAADRCRRLQSELQAFVARLLTALAQEDTRH